MWHATVSSALKGAHLAGYIDSTAAPLAAFLTNDSVAPVDGKKPELPNPAYEKWVAEDQIVLSYLFSSLSRDVFGQVATATTAAELWAAIQALHASQSWACIMSTRMALTTASKGTSSIAEYFVKMKGLADDMASAGRKLEDEELVTFILSGLGEEFESIVTAMASRVELVSINELYAQLIAFEQRKEIANGGVPQSSANLATKGGRGGNFPNSNQNASRGRNDGGGRGSFRRGGGGCGNGGRGTSTGGNGGGGRNFLSGVFCQLCGKEGHMVVRCFRRLDTNFSGPPHRVLWCGHQLVR